MSPLFTRASAGGVMRDPGGGVPAGGDRAPLISEIPLNRSEANCQISENGPDAGLQNGSL